MPADPASDQKRAAAEAAAALVQSGMVIGLGTGSTAYYAIAALVRRVREDGLRIVAIPTSERSAAQARDGGIALSDFATHPRLDLTIDGADEIAGASLDLVKGLGGALLREKIVAAASAREIIVADAAKLVDRLGRHVPVPVEVTPWGWESTAARIARLGARVSRREAAREAGGAAFVSDGGNLILDCAFGPIEDPRALDLALHAVVGVIETGLFIGLATEAFVATPDGVQHLEAR